MKSLFFLLLVSFTNCSNNSANKNILKADVGAYNDSIVFVNKNYKMIVFTENQEIKKFKLYNIKSNIGLAGKPELITIDGEIPEGTNRMDYNNPADIMGYECGNPYQFINEKIKIAFALEKGAKKRLDLSIYNSILKDFADGSYTLSNINLR